LLIIDTFLSNSTLERAYNKIFYQKTQRLDWIIEQSEFNVGRRPPSLRSDWQRRLCGEDPRPIYPAPGYSNFATFAGTHQ